MPGWEDAVPDLRKRATLPVTDVRPTPRTTSRPHVAAVLEDRVLAVVGRTVRRLGWTPRVEPFTGYGTPRRVRVVARVLLAAPDQRTDDVVDHRGFRSYLVVPAPGERVRVTLGDVAVDVTADRGGYVDVEIDVALPAGWQQAELTGATGVTTAAPVLVVDDETRLGVVSDIDDTAMVTAVPRLFLAGWNTFVRHTSARRAVPGMADLYAAMAQADPGTPFVYVSTGAWNTAATLRRFLARHGYPAGPLLLTDWGPTNTGWFRSGPQHKDGSLDRLMTTFPHVRWLLVGDDGQHDPDIYARAVQRHPGHVLAVAIRQLTPAQQVLARGVPAPPPEADLGPQGHVDVPAEVPTVGAPDGVGLAREIARVLG